MQLIHEKIIFSASGFFDINSKIIQMVKNSSYMVIMQLNRVCLIYFQVVSSVTIYLVILIQFDMAANSK